MKINFNALRKKLNVEYNVVVVVSILNRVLKDKDVPQNEIDVLRQQLKDMNESLVLLNSLHDDSPAKEFDVVDSNYEEFKL